MTTISNLTEHLKIPVIGEENMYIDALFSFPRSNNYDGIIITCPGSGGGPGPGGMFGPDNVFTKIAETINSLYAVLQIKYRYYGILNECVKDTVNCLEYISKINKPIYMIGWSLGFSVIINSILISKCNNIKGIISLAGGSRCARYLSSIYVPILIIHGTHDSVLSVNCANIIYNKANEPKEKIILNGAEHNVIGAYDHIIKWLDKYINNKDMMIID